MIKYSIVLQLCCFILLFVSLDALKTITQPVGRHCNDHLSLHSQYSSNFITKQILTIRGGSDDDEEEEEDEDDFNEETVESKDTPKERKSDFGSFLSSAYGTTDGRNEDGPEFLGESLANACKIARSQARMLVVFIPSRKPSKGKKATDGLAIESLLSEEVSQIANKRARRNGDDTGSFLFWGAKVGSSEATSAIKRLKVTTKSQKGENRPILAVVYPALSGGAKVVPKVLAQHHCSPPPTESSMVSWLDSLRKRHAKQYNSMQRVLREAQYFKERKEGYSESVKSDKERKQREKEEEEKRIAEEEAEKERQEAIMKRREDLKESLPEEETSPEAKRIAVRFADGRAGQRAFSPDQPICDVFNWVDAHYEIEREVVVLTTMNGKTTLRWNEEDMKKTLEEIGLGKITGFRVTEKGPEAVEASE